MTPLENLQYELCSRDAHAFIFGHDGTHFLFTVDEQKLGSQIGRAHV